MWKASGMCSMGPSEVEANVGVMSVIMGSLDDVVNNMVHVPRLSEVWHLLVFHEGLVSVESIDALSLLLFLEPVASWQAATRSLCPMCCVYKTKMNKPNSPAFAAYIDMYRVD